MWIFQEVLTMNEIQSVRATKNLIIIQAHTNLNKLYPAHK